MKRRISIIVLAAVLLAVLCACSLDLGMTAEAEPFVKQMLTALSVNDIDGASELIHPELEDAQAGLQELAAYLDGREAEACVQQGIKIDSFTGTGGSVKTESGTVAVTLEDGTVVYLTYAYQTTKEGSGFTTFRISLGV